MSLWGASTSDESQPKFLTTLEKRHCFADARGWIYKDPNTGLEEVLVCIGGLVTSIGSPTIAQVYIPSRNNYGAPFSINVIFNEVVSVTGIPVLELGGTYVGTGNCVFTAGNNTNELQFTYTPVPGDNVVNITIPDEITLDTGMNVIDYVTTTAQAGVNLEAAGYNNTTNVKPALTSTYIINTVPILLTAEFLTRATVASNVSINVTFSNAVTVIQTGGIPYILLGSVTGADETFTGDGRANYAAGNLSTTLTFTYPTVSGDSLNVGYVTLNNQSIVLNSGFINAVANTSIAATINLSTAGWSQDTALLSDISDLEIIKT